MKIINLTPHVLNIVGTAPIPSSGTARCEEIITPCEPIDGVPISLRSLGAVTGLPDPTPDTVCVVSVLVAQANPRADVFSPGKLVRDTEGRIVGCEGLFASQRGQG